ncbi:hypothetical protein WJX72_003289 [[Myrmecia] bisecta]|uniref:Uncharacterized protein n=1 Tax=[Myrmecia] bisecta TaxID=41462 RepID=A0AAW1P5E9_9CHLO
MGGSRRTTVVTPTCPPKVKLIPFEYKPPVIGERIALLFVLPGKVDATAWETSLGKLLEIFPTAAGRFQQKAEGAFILCNRAGVPVTFQQASELDWDAIHRQDRHIILQHTQDIDVAALLKGKEPLMKVQVTHCGESHTLLGVTVSHILTDVGGIALLLTSWAKIHGGETVQAPCIAREVVLPPALEKASCGRKVSQASTGADASTGQQLAPAPVADEPGSGCEDSAPNALSGEVCATNGPDSGRKAARSAAELPRGRQVSPAPDSEEAMSAGSEAMQASMAGDLAHAPHPASADEADGEAPLTAAGPPEAISVDPAANSRSTDQPAQQYPCLDLMRQLYRPELSSGHWVAAARGYVGFGAQLGKQGGLSRMETAVLRIPAASLAQLKGRINALRPVAIMLYTPGQRVALNLPGTGAANVMLQTVACRACNIRQAVVAARTPAVAAEMLGMCLANLEAPRMTKLRTSVLAGSSYDACMSSWDDLYRAAGQLDFGTGVATHFMSHMLNAHAHLHPYVGWWGRDARTGDAYLHVLVPPGKLAAFKQSGLWAAMLPGARFL